MLRLGLLVALLLIASAALIVVADSDGLSERMPTQVIPRRFALFPAAAGALILVVVAVAAIVP